MKLEDCKKGLLVRVLGKSVCGDKGDFPSLDRGWGYITLISSFCGEATVYLRETLEGNPESGAYSPNDLEPYEAEETEYRQLKNITPQAIYRATLATTIPFMRQFTHLVSVFTLEYEEILPFDDLLFELEVSPDLADLLIQNGFIEKVVKETWKKITWGEAGKLQPTVRVKRAYDGYEEIFTITQEPRLEYIKSFNRKELVYDSRSSFGRIEQHFITDLFNGNVYILTEGK